MVSGNGSVVVNTFASHALPIRFPPLPEEMKPLSSLMVLQCTDRGVSVIIFTTMNCYFHLCQLSSCSREHSVQEF